MNSNKTRNNHYVPQWYQKGFLADPKNKLFYLDLTPGTITLPDDRVITMKSLTQRARSSCFYQTDLYTTFFGSYINDEIETKLFGKIDDSGSRAIRAFIGEDMALWHTHFQDFFSYIDSQKLRTPKGLNWIGTHYPNLDQMELMREMQAVRNMHCTFWTEGVREIVSAQNSDTKFIISDHPVTVYNYACPPIENVCAYPNDPPISFKGSQTIFPLDKDHCLILTNLEYAQNPADANPTEDRTYARHYRNSMVRTDAFIRTRELDGNAVKRINLIIKARARRYIAAARKEWLYPEQDISADWAELRATLLPPDNELWKFGGEMYAGGYEDGSTYYQDAFGRTTPEAKYLKKPPADKPPQRNDPCGCGSGRKYKLCCEDKSEELRPSWEVMSIRERNLFFCHGIEKILGLDKGKSWEDVRRELSNEQIKEIYELYGMLWPQETELLNLLPKPDGRARALYTGIIDPRLITEFAINSTIYFDEIIVLNPFINPNGIKSDLDPTKEPHQYKQQTLINIVLLMRLMPFIEKGYVNLIPDPCKFDGHLAQQMFSMAEERKHEVQIKGTDKKIMEWLHKDDFKRATSGFPRSFQEQQLRKAIPDITEEQIENAIRYIEGKRRDDPLALLQDDIYGEEDGQLSIFNMLPNFEIALYLAQATGAFLLTDSEFRWEEINLAQSNSGQKSTYVWQQLMNEIDGMDYLLNGNAEDSFDLRFNGRFGEFRKAIDRIHAAVQTTSNEVEIEKLSVSLSAQIARANQLAHKEFGKLGDNAEVFGVNFKCLIPDGGIVHNNVQRLLLSSESRHHLNYVPMALFMTHTRQITS